tara:strand:- start:685 stop:909 length:225 start_codon:yes stop_codon:yes gene_type:complete
MRNVIFRYIASGLFLLSHGLLVLDHLGVGAALHGIGEVFFAPWAIRQRAWDLVFIALLFSVFDLWGTFKIGITF